VIADGYISVRDWRRRPPLRLSPPRRLGICWSWVNCNNHMCARGRGRDRAVCDPMGAGRLARHASAAGPVQQVRQEGAHAATPELGRQRRQVGAHAGQPNGAGAAVVRAIGGV
jgi:hypothetical protein